jgi:hypothetical protein
LNPQNCREDNKGAACEKRPADDKTQEIVHSSSFASTALKTAYCYFS